jgi:translin
MPRLDDIGERISRNFVEKNTAREQALGLSREIIRGSANAIRAVHRGEYDQAAAALRLVRDGTIRMRSALSRHQDIFHAGFLHDAQKEFVEASVTLAIIRGTELPDPEELGVEFAAYLNGLGEAVGELRRHLLDHMRRGDVSHAESILQSMDDIFSLLVTIDYPDAMTGGLRRTTDSVRGILERTRGDLTLAIRQRHLEMRLRDVEGRLDLAVFGSGIAIPGD